MDLQLKDRVIFVAGGSRGIGLAIVEACLKEGAKVAMTARGAQALETERARLAAEFGADHVWARAGDMRDSAVIDGAMEAVEGDLGPVWGAVANVGLHPSPPGFEVDDANWDSAFTQNLDSAFRLGRASLRRMTPRGEGSLVFISSIAGLAALGSPLTYGTAKAAMAHMAKEMAKIAGPANVRVNTIAPGNIIFPGGDWEARSTGDQKDTWLRWIRREVPMKRFGKPEEIASAVTFVLSPVASFLTGATIPVDGGQTR
ncbi:MAG TPA: SDR family oxidoreductase [Caulobacteraceae bacterium]